MTVNPGLAIRLPNWLGDVVMALPALEALASHGITLELFGKPWIKELFSAYDYTTYVVPNDFWKAKAACQQAKAKHFLLFPNSLSSSAMVCLAGKRGIGYRADLRRFFLSSSLKKSPHLHEIEHFWKLAQYAATQVLKIDWQQLLPQKPTLFLPEKYLSLAKDILQKQGVANDFWVICPGAVGQGVKGHSKIWPYWRELTDYLLQQGKQLVACPGPNEEFVFTQLLSKEVIILPHLNLPTYAGVMQQSSQVIANDSGPMHLAAAVNAPVLGLFGKTDPNRCRPFGGHYLGGLCKWPTQEDVVSAVLG